MHHNSQTLLLSRERLLSRARVLSLAAMAVACFTNGAFAEIPWRDDLKQAHAESTACGKPLLLHFYGDNCPWCDKLEAGAFQTAEVNTAIQQAFIPVKIHTGKNQNLVQMFKVKQIPTDVVVTPAGQVLSHGTSKQQPSDFVAMLSQSLKNGASAPNTAIAAQAPAPNVGPTPQQTAAQQPAAQQTVAQQPLPQRQAPPTTVANAPVVSNQSTVQTNPMVAGVSPANVSSNSANSFTMPAGFSGGASGQLAGARTEGLSLSVPAQVAAPSKTATESLGATPSKAPATAATKSPESQPELALEGYCAVALVDSVRWEEGKPSLGVVHLGKLYLFSSEAAMQTFLADPEPYTPVLNEIDVVRFFEERRIVAGKRTHGTRINNRMFFFADEDALEHFQVEWERYYDAAIAVMDNAIKDANPGT